MKNIWSGLLVAFSLYSAIPVPQVQWEKKTMRWALSFLPLIGVLIGGAEWLWYCFCVHFGAAELFYAVGAALLPLFRLQCQAASIWTGCVIPAMRCAPLETGKNALRF